MARVTQQLRVNESGTRTLNAVGFESGVSNPALLFCGKVDDTFIVVHSDDL